MPRYGHLDIFMKIKLTKEMQHKTLLRYLFYGLNSKRKKKILNTIIFQSTALELQVILQ